MTCGPTLIISDTHLGRPGNSALSVDALRPLWQGVSELIINGDVAEVHHPRFRAQAARDVVALYERCEQDGVTLTLLSGNHDAFLTDTRHLHLCDGQVFVTHGDALHPAIAPWSIAAPRMRRTHQMAISQHGEHNHDKLLTQLTAAQHASFAEWDHLAQQAGKSSVLQMLMRPWAIARVLHYWWEFPTLASRFAADHAPDARYLIHGHTHRGGIWKRGERCVINTGSFGFPGSPHAVLIDGSTLAFHRICRASDGSWRMAETPNRQFVLHAASSDERHSTAVGAEFNSRDRAA